MVETDWREILGFSQRELMQTDKEKLCESLSWMEADDIELNFTDLKTLFRLAQDILKYKTEQVNGLLGKIETTQRKGVKTKIKSVRSESPTVSESPLATIAHQEDLIKANKEILDQLHADIASLKERKNKLEEDTKYLDRDSESSRGTLSEINAVMQLENEITMKNKHIRKLLYDVKMLDEENAKLKEKVTVLKDKLTEATRLIDSLTEQLLAINKEISQLKAALGKSEQIKSHLTIEIETLKKEISRKQPTKDELMYEEIKYKIQHWKNIARSKKAEVEALCDENSKLKEELALGSKFTSPEEDTNEVAKLKIKELQDKILEASNEINQSAYLIEVLRAENKQLKSIIDETQGYSIFETKNESDDGKEQTIINKLKKKVRTLTGALHGAEEMIVIREKELTEIMSQLQLLQSDDGINALIEGLKNKKRQLKVKDEGIKSLIQELNNLSQDVNDLQLENETLRQKFNIPSDEKISTKKTLQKYRDMEQNNKDMCKELRNMENKLICLELNNRNMKTKISDMTKKLNKLGHNDVEIENSDQSCENNELMPIDGGGESSVATAMQARKLSKETKNQNKLMEIRAIYEENEGLRKGLQEILDFLKDNSTTSSGVLALQCPSLEAVLSSMEARHSAGWFAPHMSTVMELRAALGGKDALLAALHDARKETLDVLTQLSNETKKSSELERKLNEIESQENQKAEIVSKTEESNFEFGSWISDKEQNTIDFYDKTQIDNVIEKGNYLYEEQLKKGLKYFHERFQVLYEKMTSMTIETADELNKWTLKEEQYTAQIENLKAQLHQNDDEDSSDNSPGIIPITSNSFLERKCSYLEETYKYIRTLNENLKNESIESKRDFMVTVANYETQVQKCILTIANLTDKLRNSISIDLFWKQNIALNDIILKYRNLSEKCLSDQCELTDKLTSLESDKAEISSYIKKCLDLDANSPHDEKINSTHVEQAILQKQLQQICGELDNKNKIIKNLEETNFKLQEMQSKEIDKTLAAVTNEEVDLMRDQLQNLVDENKILKEQSQHVTNQLDIALVQLQHNQQRQMSNDMEINMLRHQILDLQSSGDGKAIVARLSSEILVAHLHASENHKQVERLTLALNKEKVRRVETEEMLEARQKVFNVYSLRYESKFRYMYELIQGLRQQYQGSLPLISIESYLEKIENISRKTRVVNEQLSDIEDLQSNLMTKHSVFDQILDISKGKCLTGEDACPHKLKNAVLQSTQTHELDYLNKKLKALEQSHEDLMSHCNKLEKTLVLNSQAFEKSTLNDIVDKRQDNDDNSSKLELENVQSEDETSTRGSQTVTLPSPKILKPEQKINNGTVHITKENTENNKIVSHVKIQHNKQQPEFINKLSQTCFEIQKCHKSIQTVEDEAVNELKVYIANLREDNDEINKKLSEVMRLAQEQTKEALVLSKENITLESQIHHLNDSNRQKDELNKKLRSNVEDLKKQIDDLKILQMNEKSKMRDTVNDENKSLLSALKQLDIDKNNILAEYQELISSERAEYSKTTKELQLKIMELQSKLDKRGSDTSATNNDTLQDIITKYTTKITDLEDKCFKSQSELDECKTERATYQSEADRWKELASERLHKMEQLNSQLEERHCNEVESYKAENQHWLSQLNETQKEHMELRTRLSDQKALYVKQLADKDAHIEQLRNVVHNLKTQVMNMQTMISVNDPSFDLSAIVEVDEASDALSQHGSDRLELKFESIVDFNDTQDDIMRINSSSSLWQDTIIERLRREKQLAGKQNGILRRQIKALAARERRARLDAQNLKNQVFRISTSGSKVATAESAALHNKIATLQAQLTSARRDTQSNVALWDKWKRAQQTSERWQSRYEEKCQEVNKMETSLNLAKSALTRLEREKRVLLSRLSEIKSEHRLTIEKQEDEPLEKSHRSITDTNTLFAHDTSTTPIISSHALLERVQAQQHRIAALEIAEKGNEYLVSEYEKSLAQITSLKGQVLKLESTLLEAQIRTPIKTNNDTQPEIDYWKSYCEMLKEENVQLTLRVNSLETTSSTPHQHKVNDLEQTVLTLRGLVSKLQAEQKSSSVYKRNDSRPSSGRSATDKSRNQMESHRIEIANLKRCIQDKDLLLERSKEMLKIAAEREDELLRENALLRRRIDDLTRNKGGFLSA